MPNCEIVCHECGKVVERGKKTAKYCEACAAMLKMCLNCERPRCSGNCSQLRALVKEEECNAT